MKRRRLPTAWLAWLTMVGCCNAGVGNKQVENVESLQISVDTEWVEHGAPGYVPIRVEIANLGEARQIEILGLGSRWGSGGGSYYIRGELKVSQRLFLRRGDRQRLTLSVPVNIDSENVTIRVQEGWRTLAMMNSMHFRRASSGREQVGSLVVSSSERTETSTRSRRGGGSDIKLSPDRLPTNWLGYSSIKNVVMGSGAWQQLDEAQKDALRRWVACGGELVMTEGDGRDLFRSQGAADASRNFFTSFLGRVWTDPDGGSRWGTDSLLDDGTPRRWTRGFALPIEGVGDVPARAYAGILILFALIIGPANYWVLWRRRRHVLLVLTSPLIAAVFIAMLAFYSIFHEGTAIHGRVESFTVLDQAARQAATRASVSLYAAGMAPAGGLRFSRDTAVILNNDPKASTEANHTVDLTDTQRLAEGFIQARTPCNFEQASFRAARERLSFTRHADHVTVVNGLGVTVNALVYRDILTVFSTDTPLRPGERRDLPVAKDEPGLMDKTRLRPRDGGKFHGSVHSSPPAGAYVALLERSPFWESGVPEIEERDSFHVVLGYVGGEP